MKNTFLTTRTTTAACNWEKMCVCVCINPWLLLSILIESIILYFHDVVIFVWLLLLTVLMKSRKTNPLMEYITLTLKYEKCKNYPLQKFLFQIYQSMFCNDRILQWYIKNSATRYFYKVIKLGSLKVQNCFFYKM